MLFHQFGLNVVVSELSLHGTLSRTSCQYLFHVYAGHHAFVVWQKSGGLYRCEGDSLCPSVECASAVVVQRYINVCEELFSCVLLEWHVEFRCPPFTAVPMHEQSHVMVVAS